MSPETSLVTKMRGALVSGTAGFAGSTGAGFEQPASNGRRAAGGEQILVSINGLFSFKREIGYARALRGHRDLLVLRPQLFVHGFNRILAGRQIRNLKLPSAPVTAKYGCSAHR